MLKLAGSILLLCSTVFISSQKVLECYFTYKFLDKICDVIRLLQFENSTNLPYKQVFEKIKFDKNNFFTKVKSNGYILRKEVKDAEIFFDNLGKRDKISEIEYINYSYEIFKLKSKEYFDRYNQIKKPYLIAGVAAGLVIIIVLI